MRARLFVCVGGWLGVMPACALQFLNDYRCACSLGRAESIDGVFFDGTLVGCAQFAHARNVYPFTPVRNRFVPYLSFFVLLESLTQACTHSVPRSLSFFVVAPRPHVPTGVHSAASWRSLLHCRYIRC